MKGKESWTWQGKRKGNRLRLFVQLYASETGRMKAGNNEGEADVDIGSGKEKLKGQFRVLKG